MHAKKVYFFLGSAFGYGVLPFLLPAPGFLTRNAALFLFYLIAACMAVVAGRIHADRKNRFKAAAEDIQSRINVEEDLIDKEEKAQAALAQKTQRYASLRRVITEISETLALDAIAEQVLTQCFSLISSNQGNCLLYLADKKSQQLRLFKSKTSDPRVTNKATQGDVFDIWALRHSSPLFIEDSRTDFRFDREKVSATLDRPVASLIAVPLFSGPNLVGLVRLDHYDAHFFNQDDLRFLATIADIAAVALENGILYEDTERLALHDGLTGLYTKGHFFELLKGGCQQSQSHNLPVSLLMVDIDHFKKYNDSFGHIAGDIVLKSLSETISGFFRDTPAICGRFGGEELCIMLPEVAKRDAMATADRLRKVIEATRMTLRRQETQVTVSIGVSGYPDDGADALELLMKADKALYDAKQAGRNRVAAAG